MASPNDAASNVAENHPGAEPGAAMHNFISKIPDGYTIWHRIGDVGYLDAQGRFWYCGRKSHRVETAQATLYTECCEAVFNELPGVKRTALVGVGPRGRQTPAIVFETAGDSVDQAKLAKQLREVAQRFDHTRGINQFLPHSPFPVDVRHNAKINREQLAKWAEGRLGTKLDRGAASPETKG